MHSRENWMTPERASLLNAREGPNHSALGDFCDIFLATVRLTARRRQYELAAASGMTVEQMRCEMLMRAETRRPARRSVPHGALAHLACAVPLEASS